MTIEQEIQRIMELWHNIEFDKIKGDLANLWEAREQLGELVTDLESLEPKVIRLLEVIPTLQRHSDEYRARTKDLIGLLHHFSKHRKDEWIRKVTSDLDFISTEAARAVREAINKLRGGKGKATTTPTISIIELENVAYQILDLIEPYGRGAPLAELPKLQQWLSQNHPGIRVESIGEMNRNLWLLIVLSADRINGLVVPALDSLIGPGEALKWYVGGRYDGTQALIRRNILSLAHAIYDPSQQIWVLKKKGHVDLV